MLRRRSETAEFWRWVLVEFEQSGLSVRAFCQREGIAAPSFYAWRKRIFHREQGSSEAQPNLVPVRVVSAPAGRVVSAPAGHVVSASVGHFGSAGLSDRPAEELAQGPAVNSLPLAKQASPEAAPRSWSQIEVTTPSGIIVRIGEACALDLIERTLLAIHSVSHHRTPAVLEAGSC